MRRGSASLVHLCIPGVGAIAASQVGTLIVANCAGSFFRGSFPEAGSGGSKATQDLPTSHEPPRARRPGGSQKPRRLTRPPGGHPGLSDLSRSPRGRLPLATGGPRGSHETTLPGPPTRRLPQGPGGPPGPKRPPRIPTSFVEATQEAPAAPRRPRGCQEITQDFPTSSEGHRPTKPPEARGRPHRAVLGFWLSLALWADFGPLGWFWACGRFWAGVWFVAFDWF